jgi:hypothetical protein
VTVLVDYPTLAGRVCELAGSGTVLPPGDITALLGQDDTLIERAVFDGPNRVRDISRARTFRGSLRRVLEVTHPRCDDPTCFVPTKDCQGDHIVPWTHGGTTSQDNGRLGCGFHNRLWYHHPHLRPPPRQLTVEPPDDPPPRVDPPDDPPTITRAAVDLDDRPTGCPTCGSAARPRAPDLMCSDGTLSSVTWLTDRWPTRHERRSRASGAPFAS